MEGIFLIKKFILASLTSTVLLSTLAVTPEVFADDFDKAIDENLNIIEETESRVHTLEETIDSLRAKVQKAEEELTNLDKDISSNEDRIKEVVGRLEAAHAEMNELQEEIEVLEEIIEKRTEQLEQQARKIQVDGQTVNYIEFIIEAESLTDVIGRIDIVSSLVSSNRKLVKAQVRDKAAVVEKQERTEQTIVQQNALAAELETISEDLEQQRLEKEVIVAQIAAERATAVSERERFLAQKAEAEQAVGQLLVAREEAAQAARAAEEQRRAEQLQREEEERVAAAEAEAAVTLASSQREEVSQEPESNSSETQAPEETSQPAPSTETSAGDQTSPASSNTENSDESGGSEESSSTSDSKSTPKPTPAPSSGTSWSSLAPHATALLGTRYLYGGSTTSGLDCSGFTSLVFRQVGKSLPRSAAGQYASAQKVSNPQPGDLVFFSAGGGRVTHVGIYTGGGQFIGSQTSTGVAYDNVNSGYWGQRFVGYGRY